MADPPPIAGVRRSFVTAHGVRFHVTEAGPADGLPVLALHGWPQHHYAWRDLLAQPPAGLRIIAPDLPGYGWSSPPPHRWAKRDIADDVLALANALTDQPILLVGHDWGGFVGYLLALHAPERFRAYLALNISHPWQTRRTLAPHLWRFLMYQPLMAGPGVYLQRHTDFVARVLRAGTTIHAAMPADVVEIYAERFRDPTVARCATDTYRTFLLREVIRVGRHEHRRASIPLRALFGKDDPAIHWSMAAADTARADDYQVEFVSGCGHFITDERPDLVRAQLIALTGV